MKQEDFDNNLRKVNENPYLYYAVNSLGSRIDSDIFLIKQADKEVIIYYLERGKEYEYERSNTLEDAYDFLWNAYLDMKEKSIASILCDKAGLYDRGLFDDIELRKFVDEEILSPTRYITEMNYSKENILKRLEAVKKLIKEKLPKKNS